MSSQVFITVYKVIIGPCLDVYRCLKYVAENAEEVMYTPGWSEVDQDILILIVQRDDLQVTLII